MAGKAAIEVSSDSTDFVEFFGKTSTLDKKLKASLRKRVREAGAQGADAVKDEVRKPPLHKRSSTAIDGVPQSRGLRRRIAEGVGSSVTATKPDTAGVSIKASAKALPPGQKRLLKKYNAERGWRHPGISGARAIARGRSSAQTLRAMGSEGAAKARADISRNAAKWYSQKGRPYFGKVLAARKDELAKAVTDAVADARRASGLP